MGKQQESKEIDLSNPILRSIIEVGTKSNPAYNPKKKGKKANLDIPPTIYDGESKQVGSGVWDGIADNAQDLHYDNTDLGLSVDEYNNYTEYGANPGPYKTREELNTIRAKNQSAIEQTGRSLTQMGLNEVLLGTALGLSNLVDMAVNVGTEKGADDYSNPFSKFLEDKQTEVRKAFEIYQENPEDTFQIDDFGWWASNAVSIASTLSMLIPSMAVTKGLSAVGKLAKLERVSMGVAKAAKAGNLTKGAYTLSKAINSGAEIGTAALLSRTMEGYLEARGVYKETYDKSLGRLESMSVDDKADLFKNNPELTGKSNEEIAEYMSGVSADETFKNDYAMLLFDIAQFKALGSMWKGVANKAVNSELRTANRAAISNLSNDGTEAVGKLGFFGKRKEIIQHALKNPMSSLTAIQLSEGLEEGYQGVQTEKGKEVAEKMFDPEFDTRNIQSYLTDSHIWEQAFWGALGGIAFQSIGTGLGNASTAIKGKLNKSKMTEQEYALSQMTDEKIREQEINTRRSRIQDFTESMQLLNANKNPFDYKLDPDTKQPILVDGSAVNQDITAEEADGLKIKLTNEFVTNMTLEAVDKGNYDLFKEYITNQNFNKFFEDAGLESNAGDKSFSQMLINKMDEVYEEYNGALYDTLNSIDVENENVAKIVARSIARRKLEINDLNQNSDDLANQIADNADTSDYIDYEEQQRIKYAEERLNEIANKEEEIQAMLDNKRISPQAAAQISKENNIRRNQLLAFASTGNMFGNPEAIERILSSNISDANTGEFIDEFNKFLATIDPMTSPSLPKKSIQDLVKKKIELDDHLDYIEKTLPTTQANYQSEYDATARNVDRLTIERYNKAADMVSEYLESQPDLDIARDNIMTNNVPANIKDQLDILKLGHHSTQRFTSQINAVLRELVKDREAAAEEARNVTVDNNTSNDTVAENEILDINQAVEATDDREVDEDDSSTGEVEQSDSAVTSDTNTVDPIQPITIQNDINDIEKTTDAILQAQANDFILDNDARAVGLANSITFNLFKTSRNLFDNLEGKDINSSEFNNIVDIVADELFTQGVSRGYVRPAAIDGIKMAMNMIYRRLNAKGVSGADKFKVLADQLATKHKVEVDEDNKASTTKLIPDSEFNQVVDEFINSYIENRGIYTVKGSKTIINVEDLFRELLTNDGISFEQAKHIFFNISDYINGSNNTKYIFTNKRELNNNLKTPSIFFNNLINNKSTTEIVDSYMHIAAPSETSANYNKSVNEALNGQPVDVTYYEGEFGVSQNSISIKRNNVEIGYLASVQPNATNTGYSLKKQTRGFVYKLDNNNGVIESNLDKFFIPLINRSNEQYSELMDIAYKQFAYETGLKNRSFSSELTNEDVDKVLRNPAIRDLISNKDIIISDKISTTKAKAKYILNQINNIIFYDNNAITSPMILESYSYWKSSTYNNYVNTHKIQTALSSNKKITTKLVNMASGKVLLDVNNSDINTFDFTYEQNPIMIVDANGNIINERNNTSYSNVAGFEPGTMGMLITDNPNAPIMALFTEANKLSSNSELANRVYTELNDLFNNFQSKTINFNQLGDSLFDLLSGPSKDSSARGNNLFRGYSVIKTNDKIALNIQGVKGEYNLIIHKFEKGSNVEGTGITYIPNGDKTKATSSIRPNKTFTKGIAKEIVSNLVFNKTFFGVNNKNVDNNKTNKYLYKEDGKLIVDVGGKKDTYNSFGHFVLANNAFKTNQGKNSDGSLFDNTERVKSLYINTAIITSPVEELPLTDTIRSATDLIKSGSKSDSVDTSRLLTLAGVPADKVSVLTGVNQFGIELIPRESYFDNKATKAEAYYSKGRMYFTNRGANAIAKSPNNLMRLLIHENLHAKFEEQGLFQRDGIVEDLMNTYYAMIESVNHVVDNGTPGVTLLKEATVIRKWVNDNKFTPTDYFTTLSAEQQRVWAGRSQEERDRQFAEEWLVESLTQPAIIRYLNNTIYTGEDISVEGIDNSAKTIWQKIIDVLLKLFGRGTGNIKNNTILAKQYSILGDNTNAADFTTTTTQQAVQQNNNTNTPGETPVNPITNEDNTVEVPRNTEAVDTSYDDFLTEGNQLDEQSDVDDLDFAVTNMIEDADDVMINSYRDSPNVNMNGVQIVTDMNKYVDQFAEQDKPIIARMMRSAEVKFRCE